MQKFEVYEDEWLRGEGSVESRLLRECDNKKCCLGFYALQILNHTEQEITGIGNLERLGHYNFDSDNIIMVNDSPNHNDEKRKNALYTLFYNRGIDVVFLPTNPNKGTNQ